jgi:uracil-DNA glycosylase
MTLIQPKIDSRWAEILEQEFKSEYFLRLKEFLVEERKQGPVYPPGGQIFAAFNLTPFNRVKVIILGQDPYHGEGQAHGLCFSVPDGIKAPPSLVNIFKELHNDLGLTMPQNGNLGKWASQGVLLLNATLTVRANQAGSHQNKGWETFTDAVIRTLSERRENLVFILWGSFAQAKASLIDQNRHHILKAAHPSPFSVEKGFFGCRHFSKTNEILRGLGLKEIDWSLD